MPATLTITPWPDPLLDTAGAGNSPAWEGGRYLKRRIKGAPEVPICARSHMVPSVVRARRSVLLP
jgi:hypothetical protein